MLLPPKPSPRHQGPVLAASAATPAVALPGWLRRAVPDTQSLVSEGLEDIAITAGAAIGALDAVVRRRERSAATWRPGLALVAAAVTARQAGRVEDEAALRDAVLLTRPGDDVGPAGRMLVAWRRLATRPAEELLTEAGIAGMLDALGLGRDDETAAGLAVELRQLAAPQCAVGMLIGAFAAADRRDLPRTVGCWFADVQLAQRLGWTHAVPLLGGEAAGANGSGRPRRPSAVVAASAAQMKRACDEKTSPIGTSRRVQKSRPRAARGASETTRTLPSAKARRIAFLTRSPTERTRGESIA